MKIEAIPEHRLSEEMAHHMALAEIAVTRGISGTTSKIRNAWRDDVRRGLGQRLAQSIRSDVYPKSEPSAEAAGVVYARRRKNGEGGAAAIVAAHESGAVIKSGSGFWLAIPTEEAGKGPRGKRMTPLMWERRTGARLQFVYRPRGPSFLVGEVRLTKAGRQRAGRMTKKGAYGKGTFTSVIFLLVPQVRLRKRLNLMSTADRLAQGLPQAIVRNWPR